MLNLSLSRVFAVQPMEVYVDDEAKLTLHGLQQHYVKLKENEKNKKLFELLDILEFNQVSIFSLLLLGLDLATTAQFHPKLNFNC